MKRYNLKSNFSISLIIIINLITVNVNSQSKISALDWQKDLEFLQTTIHTNYSFLFRKTTAKEFDKAVNKLRKEIPSLEEHEIIAGLGRIIASFQYGHTSLDYRTLRFKSIPITLYHFKDSIYITAANSDNKYLVGAKVTAIEGIPIDQVLKMIYPLVPVENEQYFKKSSMNFLKIPEVLHAQKVIKTLKNKITYTLEFNGKKVKHIFRAIDARRAQPNNNWIDANSTGELPLYLKHPKKNYYFKYLSENKSVYIKYSKVMDDKQESINSFFAKVFDFVDENEVDRFILDLRLNGGGNTYKNKPVITGIIKSKKINQTGKLYIIIGRRTYSAAQNLVNELGKYTNAVFVGEPTSENINFYGDFKRVILPYSKIPIHLSYAWWQAGPEWENAEWKAPDLTIEASFDDYRSNRDPVIEAIFNSSNENLVLDPINHLTQMFKSGLLDEVRAEAKKLIKDSKYKYFNFEARLNTIGYDLMRKDQIGKSLFIFSLNRELFPNSANTWDSLAEALSKKSNFQDIPKAIEFYKKAIELDPNGETGKNAEKMLKKINKN